MRDPVIHELKTWPEPFASIRSGAKTHEIRRNDRDYQVGDTLLLGEWLPQPCPGERNPSECEACLLGRKGQYTGAMIRAIITHLTPGGQWGLPEDLCVMSIKLEKP